MNKRSRLLIALGLLQLCSCAFPFGGLSADDQERVDGFSNRANRYKQSMSYAQAAQQVRLGLEVDPDHYKLNLLRGELLLLLAKNDADRYYETVSQFEKVIGLRSLGEHDYRAYLFYGQALQGIAISHRKEAVYHESNAKSATDEQDREQLLRQAREHRLLFVERLQDAENQYNKLLEQGDSPYQAHRHLFLIQKEKLVGLQGAVRIAQLEKAVAAGETTLGEDKERYDHYKTLQEKTFDVNMELVADSRRIEFKKRLKETHSTLYLLYFRLAKYEEALAHIHKAILLDPNKADDYYYRAVVHHALGNKREASQDLTSFRRYTDSDFDSEKMQKANKLERKLR